MSDTRAPKLYEEEFGERLRFFFRRRWSQRVVDQRLDNLHARLADCKGSAA